MKPMVPKDKKSIGKKKYYTCNSSPNALFVCGAIENNFHFLMECQRYDIMRRGMLLYLNWSSYLVIAIYQIEIMKLYLSSS